MDKAHKLFLIIERIFLIPIKEIEVEIVCYSDPLMGIKIDNSTTLYQ